MKPIIIVVLLLLGWLAIFTIFAAQRAREKEIEEQAYARGYKEGKRVGYIEGINDLNGLRKAKKLPSIGEVTNTTEEQE